MENFTQFYVEDIDYVNLGIVKENNDTKYGNRGKNKYDTKRIENGTRDLIEPIRDKFKVLEDSIRNDARFSNFQIGRATIRPRGFRFNSYYWIWMVNNIEYDKLNSKDIDSPQLSLPQVQISINPDNFTSAEIWFEKSAFDYRMIFYKYFKTNIDKLKNEFDLILLKDNGKEDNDYFATDVGETYKDVLSYFPDKKKYPEAGIRISIAKKDSINLGNRIIDRVKNDLFKLIKTVYEPVYGLILDYNLEPFLNNEKLRKDDDVLRKGTDDIVYERKHAKMQNAFKEYCNTNNLKVHIEKKRIDAILIRDEYVELIEMKPYDNVKKTIREALGQIIGYNYIYNNINKNKLHLVIAGTGKPNKSDLKYINYLKHNIKFDLEYLCFDYTSKIVKPKYY